VERYPHRNQRIILWYPTASCPYCCLSSLWLFSSLSRVWVNVRPSGCCVILRSRFIGATSNLFPLCFMPDDGAHQHHLYFSLHTPQSLDLILSTFPIITTPSLCVPPHPLLLSLLSYVHITFFYLRPLSLVYIFARLPFSVYIPTLTVVPS